MPKKKKLIILSIIIIIIGIFLGIIYINKRKHIYQINNETSYEVTLKPNTYFSNNIIKSDNYYIANSIESIDIYFNYYLKNKVKENINYSYTITATLKSYAENGTKLIWTKDFNLKNMNNLNQKEINIKEKYNLDYGYYVNYVKSFQQYYNIKTENYLYVLLDIKIDDKTNPSILVTIPINENIVEITMKENNSFIDNTTQNNFSKIMVFIFIAVVLGLLVRRVLLHKDNEETFLKEYQDIIISIQNKPNINSSNVIYLNSFKDLINIALNNNLNIFNYHNEYYIIIDNIYYIYFKDMKN